MLSGKLIFLCVSRLAVKVSCSRVYVCWCVGVRVCKFLIRQLSAVATTQTFPHSQAINFQGVLLLVFLSEIRSESFG